jgi:hypothetical protein
MEDDIVACAKKVISELELKMEDKATLYTAIGALVYAKKVISELEFLDKHPFCDPVPHRGYALFITDPTGRISMFYTHPDEYIGNMLKWVCKNVGIAYGQLGTPQTNKPLDAKKRFSDYNIPTMSAITVGVRIGCGALLYS